jgi:hypothetical protein
MPEQSSRSQSHPSVQSHQRCQECPERWTDQSRWRAYLSDTRELVFYCPECAHREFDSHPWERA